MRQEKAKMCGDEGRFDFFQEKQNSHGSRKLRIFYSQADRKGGKRSKLHGTKVHGARARAFDVFCS